MVDVESLLDEELELETELGLARARSSLLGFITWVKQDFHINWHHRVICNLIDRMVAGDVRRVIVNTPPRHGKALALDTPVATPRGFRPIGELQQEDYVLDVQGLPTKVRAVSPVWRGRPCFTVKSGSSVVVADGAHLWPVHVSGTNGIRELTTAAMAQLHGKGAALALPACPRAWRAPAWLPAPQRQPCSVTPCHSVPTVCIQVASATQQFLVGKACMPTHNSEIISRHLPAYILGRNPDESIIACSYGADLAQRMNRDCQRIIDSDPYRQVFPKTQLFTSNVRTLSQGSWLRNADMFEVVGRRGVYRAAGVGGAITGLGGSWLLADDLLKNAEDASSPTVLEKQWEWYQTTLRTRLAKGGRILLVMTRWSAGDVVGRLLDQARAVPEADQWHVLNLPAVAEGPPTPVDPRQPGEALWPEMFPLPELEKLKANGARAWQALYQGRPTPPGGAVLKEEWWRFYRRPQLPPDFDQVIISADLTFADAKRGDWNVFQVWGRVGAQAYLLDQVRGKMDFTRQCEAIVALYDRHPDVRTLRIEAAANGAALVSALRSRIPGLTAVKPGTSSKQARVESVMHHIEAGQVFLPDPQDVGWVDAFLVEAATFPHGRHDDQVDAMQIGLAGLFPPRSVGTGALPVSFGKASRWLGAH